MPNQTNGPSIHDRERSFAFHFEIHKSWSKGSSLQARGTVDPFLGAVFAVNRVALAEAELDIVAGSFPPRNNSLDRAYKALFSGNFEHGSIRLVRDKSTVR